MAARALTRWLAARASANVAVGSALARQLESILGLSEGGVTSIPNALPVLAEPAESPPAPKGRHFTVGVLARFVPHKAVDQVVAAVAALDEVRLLISGEGPDRPHIERQIWRLGIRRRVELIGWVPPEEVLDRCDLFVSAARIEGHPMALLDARRRGIPIVAADVGAVGEIVEHGVTGLLVSPGDVTGLAASIRQLVEDADLRASMAVAARSAAEAASPRAMAESYEELYWPSDPPVTSLCAPSDPDSDSDSDPGSDPDSDSEPGAAPRP